MPKPMADHDAGNGAHDGNAEPAVEVHRFSGRSLLDMMAVPSGRGDVSIVEAGDNVNLSVCTKQSVSASLDVIDLDGVRSYADLLGHVVRRGPLEGVLDPQSVFANASRIVTKDVAFDLRWASLTTSTSFTTLSGNAAASADDITLTDDITITFYVEADTMLKLRQAHAVLLWNELNVFASASRVRLTPELVSGPPEYSFSATVLRTVLGKGSGHVAADGVSLSAVVAMLTKHVIARGADLRVPAQPCEGLALLALTHGSTDYAVSPLTGGVLKRRKLRVPKLSAEAKGFFEQKALSPFWEAAKGDKAQQYELARGWVQEALDTPRIGALQWGDVAETIYLNTDARVKKRRHAEREAA